MFNCELRRWRVVRWALLGASTALVLLLLDVSPAGAGPSAQNWGSAVTMSNLTATSVTFSWTGGNCNRDYIRIDLRHSGGTATTFSGNLSTTSTSYTFTGLTPIRDYGFTSNKRNKIICTYNSLINPQRRYIARFTTPPRTGDICTVADNPPQTLGDPLPLTAGETRSASGVFPVALSEIPCLDSTGRQSKYFEIEIPSDGAGAVKVEAVKGYSTMFPEIIVRSGEDTYTGTSVFDDSDTGNEDAVAAGQVSAGVYTIQLRAQDRITDSASARGGQYNLVLTRLQPTFSTSEYDNGVTVIWDLGARGTDLEIKIEYKLTTATDWTQAVASVAAPSTSSIVRYTITALEAGVPFLTRAAFDNSSVFTESPPQLVFGDVRLPPPYNLSVENRLLSEDPLSYEVRAAWEAPLVVVEGADQSNFDWGYYVRLNEGQPYKSDGQSQEDVFIWTRPGLLAVRALVWMDCEYTAATSICDVNYGGVDYDIPGTQLWVSTWSNAGSVNLVGVVDEAGSVVGPSEPDPAVIQMIYAVFDGIGQERSETLAKTLSVLLCLALGLAGGAFILSRVGVTFIGVVLSAAFFMFIFAGLGVLLFGVPPALVVVMVVLPLMGATMISIRRMSLQ